jgi:hypothetical protein
VIGRRSGRKERQRKWGAEAGTDLELRDGFGGVHCAKQTRVGSPTTMLFPDGFLPLHTRELEIDVVG